MQDTFIRVTITLGDFLYKQIPDNAGMIYIILVSSKGSIFPKATLMIQPTAIIMLITKFKIASLNVFFYFSFSKIT